MSKDEHDDQLQARIVIDPVPLLDFVRAARRATAILGPDAAVNSSTVDVIGSELYAMALEEPEWDVFS